MQGERNSPSHIIHVGDSVLEVIRCDAVREGVFAFLVKRLAVEGGVVRARVQEVVVNWASRAMSEVLALNRHAGVSDANYLTNPH